MLFKSIMTSSRVPLLLVLSAFHNISCHSKALWCPWGYQFYCFVYYVPRCSMLFQSIMTPMRVPALLISTQDSTTLHAIQSILRPLRAPTIKLRATLMLHCIALRPELEEEDEVGQESPVARLWRQLGVSISRKLRGRFLGLRGSKPSKSRPEAQLPQNSPRWAFEEALNCSALRAYTYTWVPAIAGWRASSFRNNRGRWGYSWRGVNRCRALRFHYWQELGNDAQNANMLFCFSRVATLTNIAKRIFLEILRSASLKGGQQQSV